jgi:hypothetical protein
MMISTTADNIVVEKGMRSLINAMGVVDAERFIAIMNREKANYDDWRTSYFGKMTPEEYEKGLLEFEKNL